MKGKLEAYKKNLATLYVDQKWKMQKMLKKMFDNQNKDMKKELSELP